MQNGLGVEVKIYHLFISFPNMFAWLTTDDTPMFHSATGAASQTAGLLLLDGLHEDRQTLSVCAHEIV